MNHSDATRDPIGTNAAPVVGMPLSAQTIELLEASYARVEPRARAIALEFYDDLFEALPTLRAVFPRDDAEQRRLGISFVGFVIANLRAPARLMPLLERMGARGMLQDLSHEEIASIGRIFLLVLREFEGTYWSLETSHAWALCATWTIGALKHGAEHAHFARTG